MNNYCVIGDSHSECFYKFTNQLYVFAASSAKGLNNINSYSKTAIKIIDILKNKNIYQNIIFLFGKVDIDFVLNYKYNKNELNQSNYKNYLLEIVNSYVNFIKKHKSRYNVCVCELPIPHCNDEIMLKILNMQRHKQNINKNNLNLNFQDVNYKKIFDYNTRLEQTLFFNETLKKCCIENNFRFIEINKYFKNNKDYKIPNIYISRNKLDHHLKKNIYKLYISELG